MEGSMLVELPSKAQPPEHDDGTTYARGKPSKWDEKAGVLLKIHWEEVGIGERWPERLGGGQSATYFKRTIAGYCPQCGGLIGKDISPVSSKRALLDRKRDEEARGHAEDLFDYYCVACNCICQHKDAPSEGGSGCGAEGGIKAKRYPPQVDTSTTSWDQEVWPEDLDAEHRAVDAWVEQARQEELPRARQLAQQWLATFSAITGLVAVGSIIGADDAIHALDSPWSWIYVGVGGIALVLAVVAIVIGSRAAGLRDMGYVSADVRARLGLRQAMVGYSKHRLRISQWLALAALIAVVVSLGVRYFGPSPSQPTKVEVMSLPAQTANPTVSP
jgi:hypothetical protein